MAEHVEEIHPVGGGDIRVLRWDEDTSLPVLLLVHGFGQTANSWIDLAAQLKKQYRIVAFDQRGHGDSFRAADSNYSREAMVEDLLELGARLGLDRFHLVGMSMGAEHSVLFAKRRPESLRSMVLVDWAPEVKASGVAAIRKLASLRFDSFDRAVRATMAFNPRRSEDNIRERLRHSMKQFEDGSWRWKVDAEGMLNSGRFDRTAESLWPLLPMLQVPTLLIRGAQSSLLSEENANRVVELIPQSRLTTVEGAGHSVAGDRPEACAIALRDFYGSLA